MAPSEKIKTSVKDDELLDEWFSIIEAAENTKRNYLQGMALYTEFTNMTPSQLLEEAESEITSGILPRKRSIRKHLLGFRDMLKDKGYAPKTVSGFMVSVRSFYKSFDIDIPQLNKRKSFQSKPLEENRFQVTKEHIRGALKYCDVRDRAIILTMASSGLSQSDVLDLTVGKFRDGYDEETGITTLKLRRIKTKYDFITFLSPETSEAILTYLEWRDRTPKLTWHPDIMRAFEKRRIRSNNDYLFVKKDIPSKYLKTLNEEDRKLNAPGLMSMFRDIAKQMGMESDKGQWQYFRAHNLRKFFNSTLLNTGCDLFLCDFLMGHQIDATRSAYFMADPERLRELYMRYIPFLSVEDVEARVLTSESYEALVTENQEIKSELEELKAKIEAYKKPAEAMDMFLSDEKRFNEFMEFVEFKKAQMKG